MIISKSVPLEISRKRFSQFLDSENPAEVIFVGYREEESEDGINVPKKNVKIKYADIEKYIIKAIKADPGWGQGGGSGGGNKPPTEEDVEKYDYGAVSITCGLDFDFEIQTDEDGEPILDEEGNTIPVLDDDGNPIPKLNEDGNPVINRDENDEVIIKPSDNWDEKAQSNIINLQDKKGFIEINAGGNYLEDYIMFSNPVIGSITHVVVDNTGLPLPNPAGVEEGDKKTYEKPKDDFVLYYGRATGEWGDAVEIFRVPVMCRGVVQILHSSQTDLVLYSSYTELNDRTSFVRDMIDEDTQTNDPVDRTPEGNNDATKFYIDMNQYKGFIEFPTGERDECTFVFSNPELGSSTYIVVDNTEENYNGYPVTINYGKTMDDGNDENGKEDDWIESEVTTIENEKVIIEVFHSLSADIIVKITKV